MDPSEYFILFLFAVLGLFSITASLFNFEWYFETSAAQTFVKWFGRQGARVFYFILGLVLVLCGALGFIYWK